MRELVRAEGWDVYHYPALLKGLYEASAYSFLHRAEKGPWKASAHTDPKTGPCSMARGVTPTTDRFGNRSGSSRRCLTK